MKRRNFIQATAAAGLLHPLSSWSQNDGKVLRLFVGFPPGGSVDSVCRTITPYLQEALGHTVIIENKPGAGGRIAVEAVKTAKPDGLSMLITPASMMTLYPSSFKELRYDPVNDLVPVAGFMEAISCLVVSNQVPAKNFAEYIAWVKADAKSRSSFGSPADGSMPHFLGMTTMHNSGLEVTPVPYRGAAPLIADVMGGHMPAGIAPTSDALEGHNSGKLKIVAIGGSTRFDRLPNVPTFNELGLNVTGGAEWYGAFLPKGTPKEIVAKYQAAMYKAMQAKEIKDQFEPKAWMIKMRTADDLAKTIQEDIGIWRSVLARLKYTPQ